MSADVVTPLLRRFYCTFGQDHLQGQGHHAFVEVIAYDSAIVHEAMYHVFKNKWSFCYTAEKFKGQVEQYHLHCIGVIEHSDIKDWVLNPNARSEYPNAR